MAGDLTLRQLSYFVALADTRHFRRAAERVGISQPSLSQQILGLEAALGVNLVERGQRGAVLTPQGRTILEQARRILDETTTLRALAQDAKDGVNGTIRLGSTPTLGPYLLPHARSHPPHGECDFEGRRREIRRSRRLGMISTVSWLPSLTMLPVF